MHVNHDFHIHTHLSLCAPNKTGTVQNYIESAKKHGLNKLGFADHFWGSEPGDPEYYKTVKLANHELNPVHFYGVQNFEHISQIRPELEKYKDNDIKLYFGAECEYDPFKKSIAVSRDHVEEFDFLIVPNSHTHMMMPASYYEPYEKHIQFMFDAFYDIINCEFSKYITSIAHPFSAVACPYDRNILNNMITDDEYKRAFDAAANKNIAMEINVSSICGHSPRDISYMNKEIRMMRLARECGCKFTFGSDAHDMSAHENYSNSNQFIEILGLTEDDIAPIAR